VAANPAEDKAAVTTSTVLPFKQQEGGGGWDSDAILKTTGIPADIEAGKAISEGPKKVWDVCLEMATQMAGEMKTIASPDDYFWALYQASTTCSLFGSSITFLKATYGGLIDFAVLSYILAKGGEEKKLGLIAWSKPPQAASATDPAAEAPGAGEKSPAPSAASSAQQLSEPRAKVVSYLDEVMGGKYKHGTKEEQEKFTRLTSINVEKAREDTPGYTTCGVLVPYILEKLGGVTDPGILSGFGWVKDGRPVMIKKTAPDGKVKEEQLKVGGKLVFKYGAVLLGAWIDNDGKAKPKPGDIYVLWGIINAEKVRTEHVKPEMGQRHVGFIYSITEGAGKTPGTDLWKTADAGQGEGVAQEAIKQDRDYDPKDKSVTGKIDKGTVVGWVDLELLLQKSAEKETAEKATAEAKATK
jgi:hypothetical protein